VNQTHFPSQSKRGNRRLRQNKRSGNGGQSTESRERLIANSAMSGSSSDDHLIIEDFSRRGPSNTFTASPPKSLGNQIHWVRTTFSDQVLTSTTVIIENNAAYAANSSLTQVANWLAVFDQYTLAEAYVTIACTTTGNNTATVSLPQVYTAIDYDNTVNLGSLAGIQAFQSCNVSTLGPGKSVTRRFEPRVVSSASGLSFVAPTRQWITSALGNVLFNGFRCITNNTPAGALSLDRTTTLIWAFRDSV
jgi:hypothetical protein